MCYTKFIGLGVVVKSSEKLHGILKYHVLRKILFSVDIKK